jgi:UDP-galactopyranose mutase
LRALVIGAGFSGATVARRLAEAEWRVDVLEKRRVPGGHCATRLDPETGILVHTYGPHIFHTDSAPVWEFVRRYADMHPYLLTVRARVGDEVYPLPITLQTINQFFRRAFAPAEARAFIESRRVKLPVPPRNFAEQAVSMFGQELYEAFFKGYTMKQWGRQPEEIPSDVLKRLPFRFNYNQSYFFHKNQGIPRGGYTDLITKILEHPRISVHYGVTHRSGMSTAGYDHVVFTGPLDEWFDYSLGRLPYRTLDFENFVVEGDFQGCPVMNYCDADVPFTRITEHKHFAPWQSYEKSILSREYSREAKPDDERFYPVQLAEEEPSLRAYRKAASQSRGVSFVGRLATFRYIDMDVAVGEAIDATRCILDCHARGQTIPAFPHEAKSAAE